MYTGQWSEGLMSGEGTYYQADGCTYQGRWRDDLQHGQGWVRGSVDEWISGSVDQWVGGSVG